MSKRKTRVRAHINQVGFSKLTTNTMWRYTFMYPWGQIAGPFESPSSGVTTAVSFKSPTFKSDGFRPTSYSRHVLRMESVNPIDFKDLTYTWKGDTSLHARSVILAAQPGGVDFTNPVVPTGEALDDQAVVQARNNLIALKVLLLEDVAQVKQTVGLVTDIYNTLVTTFLHARKGQWNKVRQRFRALKRVLRSAKGRHKVALNSARLAGNSWLAYMYGIRPLLSSLKGLTQALTEDRQYRPSYVSSTVDQKSDPMLLIQQNGRYSVFLKEGECRFSSRCYIQYQPVSDITKLASELGLTNPIVVGWALLPYSFVVDWLIPIEDWLSSLVYSKGVNVLHTVLNRSYYANASFINASPGEYDLDITYPNKLPQVRIRAVATQRLELFVYMPSLYLNVKLNPSNLLSAAALILQKV